MKKVSSRQYAFKKTLDYIGVGLLLVALLFFWQLYSGPISVPFLKPYIVQALNYNENENQITLDGVNIEFVRSLRPLNITAENVRYINHDESVVIEAPKVSLSFSIKALIHGMIAPSRIEINKPKLSFFMTYGINETNKNEINKKKTEFYIEQFEDFVERFNSEDKLYPESYINDIIISGAEVELHEVDVGRKWSFSDLNYNFERNFSDLSVDFNTLINTQDRSSALGLKAKYKPQINKIAFEIYVSEAYFSDLMKNALPMDIYDKLYKFDIPVNANFSGIADVEDILKNKSDIANALDTAVEQIAFNIDGGDGFVVFSEDENMNYPVKNFMLTGAIEGGLDTIAINKARFDIDDESVDISFKMTGLKKYFLSKSLADMQINLQTNVETLPLDKLSVYWPKYLGEPAWQWCKDSIYGGMAKNAAFEFSFGYDDKLNKVVFQKLRGNLDIEDSNIDYLRDLPVVKNFYGSAKFDDDSIYIKVDKGVADGVRLNDGFVHLYDLAKEHNMIKIRLIGEAEITDALNFINHEPLVLANDLGINPDNIKGSVDVNLMLGFELKQSIEPQDINVEVTADLHDVEIKNIMQNKSVKADKLELLVDNQGMKIFGKAKFDNIPIYMLLDEKFADRQYKSRYAIDFRIDDNTKQKFGIDFSLLDKRYMSGYADLSTVVTIDKKDNMVAEVRADLSGMSINYDFLGFVKRYGEPAEIYTKLDIKDAKVINIPLFTLSKPDFSMSGNIKLDKKGDSVKLIDIKEVKGDKMNAKAQIEFLQNPQKIKVNVTGNSYNLTTLFEKDKKVNLSEENEPTEINKVEVNIDSENDIEDTNDTDVFIAVGSLWTNSEVPIKDFSGSAILRRGIGVHELHMSGNYGGNQAITMKLDYVPKAKGEYFLSIDSNNAGTTLKVLRLYDYMRGGNLKIEARRDKNKEFFGHAQIRNFNLHDTPLMAKLFTVASLTGLVNLLSGEGIAFSHFDAPFEYRNKTLYVKNARSFGNVLGMSGTGTYNRSQERLNINGMITPAYSLNTMIGKIPLVGNLLSGKDGTVFAANYSIEGKIDNPQININPLSALPPNSIKEFFGNMFGN